MSTCSTSYTLEAVADMLNLTKSELVIWLRRYRIIGVKMASPEFVLVGYLHNLPASLEDLEDETDNIYVTTSGVEFLKKLRDLLDINITKWL